MSSRTVTSAPVSGWAPLRSPAFRDLWSAQFVSNVGSWMQTVAAQWLMLVILGQLDGMLAGGQIRVVQHYIAAGRQASAVAGTDSDSA